MMSLRILCLLVTLVVCVTGGDDRSAIIPQPAGFPKLFNRDWNAGTMKYDIEYKDSVLATAFTNALSAINSRTCISLNFVGAAASFTGSDNINFMVSASATCNPVAFGRQTDGTTTIEYPTAGACTQAQFLRLVLAHLGLNYMHQRSDRNDFVQILPVTTSGLLFDIPTAPAGPPQTFGLPYDYGSAMSVGSLLTASIFNIGSMPAVLLSSANDALSALDECLLFRLYSHADCTAMVACSGICLNGATCIERHMGNPCCVCAPFYTGPTCSMRIPQCTPNPCMNSGVCSEGSGSTPFTCACATNFAGLRCEQSLLTSGWFDGNNDYQYMTTTAAGWYDAKVQCMMMGGRLAHKGIRNPPTFSVLKSQFTASKIWVGLSAKTNFPFLYEDLVDEVRTWTPWKSGEPSKTDGKLCAAITNTFFSRLLATFNCNDQYVGLCEKPLRNRARNGYAQGNGKEYFITPSPTGYNGAETQCREYCAHLAVLAVDSTSVLGNVVNNVFPTTPSGTNEHLFLGYEDVGSVRIFKSLYQLKPATSNILIGDSRWLAGQPSSMAGQKCLATTRGINGQLDDVTCINNVYYGLCEIAETDGSPTNCPSGNTCPNGVCAIQYTTGRETCKCNLGYAKNAGGSCVDFNECLVNPCGAGETCVNSPGSYTCISMPPAPP